MGYLRCEACGAKALSAASTCPRCAEPFALHDGRGARVALKKCSSCGIMHRRDRTCHWCADVRPSAWRSPALLRSATGIAAITLVAVGSWTVREQAGDVLTKFYIEATKSSPAPVPPTYSVEPQATVATALPLAAEAPLIDSLLIASAAGELDAADSIQWVPAVARTWVNVRRDASRIGDVVGVIKPSEKAMLGIGRYGWRQVKAPEVTGWVDPRLFEADSLRTRG